MTMPLMVPVKLSKVGNSLKVTIPSPVVKQLNLTESDTLLIGVEGSRIVIAKP